MKKIKVIRLYLLSTVNFRSTSMLLDCQLMLNNLIRTPRAIGGATDPAIAAELRLVLSIRLVQYKIPRVRTRRLSMRPMMFLCSAGVN